MRSKARETFEVSFDKFLQVCARFYEFLQVSEDSEIFCKGREGNQNPKKDIAIND